MAEHALRARRPGKRPQAALLASLPLAACASSRSQDKAIVDSIEVASAPGDPPPYTAIATGILSDACARIGETTQTNRLSTVRVMITTDRADADTCAQALTPFEEEIELDVEVLEAGECTVDVNGATVQSTLTEDH